jgi:ABC-2 type transport system ATP-binding protein
MPAIRKPSLASNGDRPLSGQPAITAVGLRKRFGSIEALAGVDLEASAGTVLALLGPNGAGKTTTVRILATLLRPDEGRAQIAGRDVVREAAAVRRLIGLSGQYAAVDGFLTGRENLRMIGRLYGLDRRPARRRADELLERVGLAAAAQRTVRTYSGGMRRRLDLAASLVAEPSVLFLDEPTTGLDPHGRIGIWQLLDELRAKGRTLLLTTQDMSEAERLADEILVIDDGRVIAGGTVEQLKRQIGGDRIELATAPGDDPAPLAGAVASLAAGSATVDRAAGRVILPVFDGPSVLPEVAERLAAANLRVTDVSLRRPTLEDVFLTLTGEHRHPVAGAEGNGHHGSTSIDGRGSS